MAIAIAATLALEPGARRRAPPARCSRAIGIGGGVDRRDAGGARRDDPDARARRAAAQLRRPRRGARRLLARSSSATAPAARCRLTTAIEVYIDVVIGAITTTGSILAFVKLRGSVVAASRCSCRPPLPQPRRCSSASIAGRACSTRRDGRPVGAARSAPRSPASSASTSSRRSAAPTCRSSSRCSTATRAGPPSAAGFMLGNDLLIVTGALVGSSGAILSLHHVPGDESLDLERDLRRLRRRTAQGGGRPGGSRTARSRRSMHADARRASCTEAKNVVIVPGYGMAVGARPARGARADRGPAQARRQRPLRDPPGRRSPPRPHERAARRGQRAVRHRARDGRDQRRLADDRRRDRDRRERHREPGRRGRSDRRRSPACRCSRCGRPSS